MNEPIAVMVSKAVGVLCFFAMALIVAAAFWKGRGAESAWPDASEPQQADVPSSTDR